MNNNIETNIWRENFPKVMKGLMYEAKVTQKEMADRLNTSEACISRYMACNRVPKATTVYRMAQVVDVDVAEIYKRIYGR